ncbi:MAG TPA: YraN family protein [Rubricoccaceae bacterium]|nr:YraN family protein [Rubricoccaceae bacterium]
MSDPPSGHATGEEGEALAAAYLEAKGFRVLETNYRFSREEIDLVCFRPEGQGGELVFVEVKTRRGHGFGRPEEAVGPAKRKAILRTAEAYLHEHRLEGASCRFDVVAITLGRGEPQIEHFEHAFGYFF